jgi:hypothetical protein
MTKEIQLSSVLRVLQKDSVVVPVLIRRKEVRMLWRLMHTQNRPI